MYRDPVCQGAQNSTSVGISKADRAQEAPDALSHSCPLGAVITAKVDLAPCTPFLTQGQVSQSREGEPQAVAELVEG